MTKPSIAFIPNRRVALRHLMSAATLTTAALVGKAAGAALYPGLPGPETPVNNLGRDEDDGPGCILQGCDANEPGEPGYRGNCFLQGTLIKTPFGRRPIETLSAGTPVVTKFGGVDDIAAVNSTRVFSSGALPMWAVPVRIMANSLGEGRPATDLFVSQHHGILLNNELVAAGNLLGRPGIWWAEDMNDSILYLHLILKRGHNVVHANGLACESLLLPSEVPCLPTRGYRIRNEVMAHLRAAFRLTANPSPSPLSGRPAAAAARVTMPFLPRATLGSGYSTAIDHKGSERTLERSVPRGIKG